MTKKTDMAIERREVKVLKLVLEDRASRKRYEKMIERGWTADSVTKAGFPWRGQTVVFSRPKR